MSGNRGRGNYIGTDATYWGDRSTNKWYGIWKNKDVNYYSLKSPAPQWATGGSTWAADGGTISIVGSDTVHTFNSPGTFSATGAPKSNARVLLVGAGGAGAGPPGYERGAGGGGGVLYGSNVTLQPGVYSVSVSGNSVAFGVTAYAGGSGNLFTGNPGGSGGGGGGFNQGYPGGSATQTSQTGTVGDGAAGPFTGYGGGGGGGNWEGCGGAGGSAGFNNDISGTPTTYGAGGGYCTGAPGYGNGNSTAGVVIIRYPNV